LWVAADGGLEAGSRSTDDNPGEAGSWAVAGSPAAAERVAVADR
jgi:hypothetical protein